MTDDISPVLIAQSGPLRGERWVLSKSKLIIGRDSDCDIVKADNNLVRYFQVEYGREWESALEQHLYQKKINNVKKAA